MQTPTRTENEFTVYVRNLDSSASLADVEELLYELFLQAGPLSRVCIPGDRNNGSHKGYGFVEFLHKESVPYCIDLLNGLKLLGRPLLLKPAGVAPMASTPSRTSGAEHADSPNNHHHGSIHDAAYNHLPFSPSPGSIPPFYLPDRPSPSMELSPHRLATPHPLLPPPHPLLPLLQGHFSLPPLPPPHAPPHAPPTPLVSPTSMEQEHSHHMYHKSRIHSKDHPRWLREGTRDRLSQYHRHESERHSHHHRSSQDDHCDNHHGDSYSRRSSRDNHYDGHHDNSYSHQSSRDNHYDDHHDDSYSHQSSRDNQYDHHHDSYSRRY